jgi:Xaa-Pro aminopeptidase
MSEVLVKIKKLRDHMAELKIPALRLKSPEWFSWATAGGQNQVIFTSEVGVAEVFITSEKTYVLTNKIEYARMKDEEVPDDFELVSFPWEHPSKLEEFIKEQNPAEYCYSDHPSASEKKLPPSFQKLRLSLMPEEQNRYRLVGQWAAEAMTEALIKAEPSWSENELAAEGAKALWSRGLDPTLVMVGSHRRSQIHRHPVAGEDKLGDSAMMVFCARGFGLYANLTRHIYFRTLKEAEKKYFNLCADVEAAAFQASVPGKSLREIYQYLANTYRRLGHPHEVEQHHQGGPTGYLSREYVVSPESPEDVTLSHGMALAWNPSFPGAKIEDTVLIGEQGLEILTVDTQWPTHNVAGRRRPDIWMKL